MLTKLLSSFVGHLKPNRVSQRSRAVLELPPPEREGGAPLMNALSRRQSEREFDTTPLPPQVLSNLLWAAFGINRPPTHGRTAPSALNAQQIDLYAAMAEALYVYDAKHHTLNLVAQVDARRVTGFQDFVDGAPLDLVYVADAAHLAGIPKARASMYSAATAGAIAQNVYLYCASAGLATVARALFDANALATALGLSEDEEVLLTQTVGYRAPDRGSLAAQR